MGCSPTYRKNTSSRVFEAYCVLGSVVLSAVLIITAAIVGG